MKNRMAALAILGFAAFSPSQSQSPAAASPSVIRVGTRLVEVDVVVRDKNGPVKGLTADDFTLLDQGKKQKIAVFSAGASSSGGADAQQPAVPLPAGTVSNRIDRSGHPVSGATVVLLDLLNTSFDNQDYGRSQLLKHLQSAGLGEKIAIYLLGQKLGIVQDFTDNRDTLVQAVRKWDPEELMLLTQNTENMDAVDRAMQCGQTCQEIRNRITSEAIQKIAQHLAGMPGRRTLVWLSDAPTGLASPFLSRANIHLYPVLIRSVGTSGVAGWTRDAREAGIAGAMAPPPLPSGDETDRQRANAALAAANGGVAFKDSRDISLAIRTAIEDASTAYVLGFYPAEETMDNKPHSLTVNVGKKRAARGRTLEIGYRTAYFAARREARAPDPASIAEVLINPLAATAIGITASRELADQDTDTIPDDPAHPVSLRIKVNIDLHDVELKRENGKRTGVVEMFYAEGLGQARTRTLNIDIPDDEFASMLDKGFNTVESIDVAAGTEGLRVVAQDQATGNVGSVTVPLNKR